MSKPSFNATFGVLTESSPFPWQLALYDRFVAGDVPTSCEIPTGLGKTSVIAIWLIARANGAPVPRRLVYIVNRRTVVDQTTEEIRRLHTRCETAGLPKDFAVSTLRGQMADNRAWSADPSKPAVICGTVDMIGSRLLFSGYRIGFRARPLHAGFLGQDSLIVHDEAHLEPAFQRLLEDIEAEQRRAGDKWPLRLMALTATSRSGSSPFRLGPEDEENTEVRRRLRAAKRLALHEVDDRGLVEAVVDRAMRFKESGRAVVVFLRSVDDVSATVTKLAKAGASVQQLTGTMRGYERERLLTTDPVLARFLRRESAPSGMAAFLVCTSAGEVGVNLSADDLIGDLSTFDSMAQRFGRLNRFGLRSDSEAHVFHPPDAALDASERLDARRLATLHLLRDLHGDASAAALGALDVQARLAAFAPSPEIVPTSDILFDRWTATTLPDPLPGRPPVEPYLHGVADWEPPTTQVAWRAEVALVRTERLLAERQELLDDYPLKPQEILSDRTTRVLATLSALADASGPDEFPVWLLDVRGNVVSDLSLLSELVTGDRRQDEQRLAGATVLLSPRHCRPVNGVLSAEGLGKTDPDPGDVADCWFDEKGVPLRARILGEANAPAGMRLIRTIVLGDEDENDDGTPPPRWSWYEVPRAADNDGSKSASRPVLLDVHGRDVEREAARIVEGLSLEDSIKQAVIVAARLHDIGKDRRAWQLSIGNRDRALTLAKSGRGMAPVELTPYRHELGSVLDAPEHALFAGLTDEQRDLALHLVAAHHGRARPHFPAREKLFDPECGETDVAAEGGRIMERFARLQKRFGRWGLAYLESLVRAADYAASANPSEVVQS